MSGTREGGRKAAESRSHGNLNAADKKGAASGNHEKRVEAGKKAAQTRGHESLSAAGRKGGQNSHGGGRSKNK